MTSTRRAATVLSLATCVVVSVVSPIHGQQASTGVIASGSVSADPDTRWSLAGSIGYRLNKVLVLGTELTWSSLKYSLSDEKNPYETVTFSNPRRDLVSFTTNMRIEIRPSRRVVPYLVTGGGIAADTVAYTVTVTTVQPTSVRTQPRTVESSVFLGLLVGGGVNVLVTDHVSVDGDLRGLYMRGHNGQWGRVGVGASYRF